jgi:hypothetical protein
VTKRKPLGWYDTGYRNVGINGRMPTCIDCMDYLTPLLVEACYSVAIETGGDPADLAKRTLDEYHAKRHTT